MFSHRTFVRIVYSTCVLLFLMAAVGILLLLESKMRVYDEVVANTVIDETSVTPFPVSVNPQLGVIESLNELESAPNQQLATATGDRQSWWRRIVATFASRTWYQNLASPVSRIIVIWPGERKEEAAQNIGDVLRWTPEERAEFITLIDSTDPVIPEGKFYPGQYVTHRDVSPAEVATLISSEFEENILRRYTPEVAERVPLEDALIIASLLEREASDFENMREIAGVIWNRLFIDMPLQLDATLQYARGSRTYEPEWWPVPRPRDKFIDSPFNTYSNEGLPPAPIANPSSDAVLAALNPIPTDCLFYFHGPDQSYYCSVTYEEHVEQLKRVY